MKRVGSALFLGLVLGAPGCSEQELHRVEEQNDGDLGSVAGRICDIESQVWLAGALVYTNLFDDNDVLYDTRITRSDEEGRWELEDLPGERQYDIFIQYSGAIVENFGVKVDGGEAGEMV